MKEGEGGRVGYGEEASNKRSVGKGSRPGDQQRARQGTKEDAVSEIWTPWPYAAQYDKGWTPADMYSYAASPALSQGLLRRAIRRTRGLPVAARTG